MPYVGAGNSTNKKDAEKNAARDYVNFLVRTGKLNANEIPANALEQGGALPARMSTPAESVPMFQVCKYLTSNFELNLDGENLFFFFSSRDKGPKMSVKLIVV